MAPSMLTYSTGKPYDESISIADRTITCGPVAVPGCRGNALLGSETPEAEEENLQDVRRQTTVAFGVD